MAPCDSTASTPGLFFIAREGNGDRELRRPQRDLRHGAAPRVAELHFVRLARGNELLDDRPAPPGREPVPRQRLEQLNFVEQPRLHGPTLLLSGLGARGSQERRNAISRSGAFPSPESRAPSPESEPRAPVR